MDNKDALIISLAAMCHDIGKFVQGCFDISKDYIERNQSQYQPVFRGRYSHLHALYTAAFLEFNKQMFPTILFSRELGEDNFLNLSAMHHKPETPRQWVIAVADRLSSGWDRDKFLEGEEIPISEFKSTRLIPIFEEISIDRRKEISSLTQFQWCYDLTAISPTSIFPKIRQEKEDPEDYDRLYKNFLAALKGIVHREESLFLWMQHFDSIYRKYTSFVPAARVGRVVPDVSLYHHSRTTASIATALYLFHKNTNSLSEEDIKADGDKFLIIAGDFFGIQKFIFSKGGEEAHHRSKLLRGRSFLVSLFCELAAEMLCDEIGLSPYSVLLNSAGKFYILGPNLPETKQKVEDIEEKINDWLIKMSYGETSLGISMTPAKVSDFSSEGFWNLWQRVQNNIQTKKFHRFDPVKLCGVFSNYLDEFNNKLSKDLCPLCGKRPSSEIVEGSKIIYPEGTGSACVFCRDHIMLGTNLVKNNKLAVLTYNQDLNLNPDKSTLEPLFGKYIVTFVNGQMRDLAKKGILRRLWATSLKNGEIPEEISYFPLNGYVPVYEREDLEDERLLIGRKTDEKSLNLIDMIKVGDPKTFTHIALSGLERDTTGKWLGVDNLGILKADVDDLGLIFGCGLSKSRFTISRLYAMSTQFNNFFSLYIPYLLESKEEFKNIYTVFAGGDDLFLIGPWNKIIEFALDINKKFSDYVCRNEEIHFSAGISIVKSNTPIDIIAQQSEKSLENAKHRGKNAISIFERVIKWDEFSQLIDEKAFFKKMLEDELISKSMLYKLNEILDLADREVNIINKGKSYIPVDASVFKWRSFLTYMVFRNLKIKDKNEIEKILIFLIQNIQKYRGDMKVPLWILLYNLRRYK